MSPPEPRRGRRRLAVAAALATLAGAALGLAWRASRDGAAALEPGEELARLESFVASARRHALETSWRDLADPRAEAGPPSGVLPLTWVRDADVERLAASLPGAEDRAALRRVRDEATWTRARADAGTSRALAALSAARSRGAADLDQDAIDRALLEALEPSARRAAWMRAHAIDEELAPLVRDVARARNAWAARTGARPALAVLEEASGRDAEVTERLRAHVAEALAPRPGEGLADPWDAEAADPELAARLAVTLDAAGCLGRAREALELAGLPPNPAGLVVVEGRGAVGFSAHATFAVAPPDDVRVALTPGAGIPGHWACLHEMGHAAQALLVPRGARPSARWPASGAVAEGCAKVLERLAFAPEWLRRQGVAEADIAALAAWERVSERARGRDILADVAFEEALHEEPEGDLDAAWARIRAEIASESAPLPSAWAGERSAAFEPTRRLDYLLARCAQAAIYRRLRALPGGLLGEPAREVLRRDVLEAPAGARYEEWFERAAGGAPSCDAWLEDVVGVGEGR